MTIILSVEKKNGGIGDFWQLARHDDDRQMMGPTLTCPSLLLFVVVVVSYLLLMALLLRFSSYIRTCESLSAKWKSWSKWQSSTVMCSASWWASCCCWPSLSPLLMSCLMPDLFFLSYIPFGLFLFLRKFLFLLWLSDDRRQRFRRERCPPFITRWPTHEVLLLYNGSSNDFAIRIYAVAPLP